MELTFALVAAAPGNVAYLIAERPVGADGEMIAKIASDIGLNDPLPVCAGWEMP